MKTTRTLMLAAATVLSLGVGAAMAQESAGGVDAMPYETMQLNQARQSAAIAGNSQAAYNAAHAPQYGSSDVTTTRTVPVPTLLGADGNGG